METKLLSGWLAVVVQGRWGCSVTYLSVIYSLQNFTRQLQHNAQGWDLITCSRWYLVLKHKVFSHSAVIPFILFHGLSGPKIC